MEAREKCDQVVREGLIKIVQVILQARISFQPTERKKINKWFNTELEEIERISEELAPSWRTNVYQPLFLDIYFQPNRTANIPSNYTPLMERWKIHYDPGSDTKDIELPTLYKHLVLLVRSLHGSLRLMPAYHVFRNCNKNKTGGSSMTYTFSTEENTRIVFPSQIMLGPVHSPFGSLLLGSLYKEDCSFENRSTHESLLSAQIIIKDYQPSEQPPISQSPSRGMDIPVQRIESVPYEAARSAPIGIPGKGRNIEDHMMAVASPPHSLTTGRYNTPPYQNAIPVQHHLQQQQQQQQPYKYSSSLPNQAPMFSTPPFSTGLPFPNSFNTNNNQFMYGVGASSTNSSNSNSSASGSGSTPFNYTSPMGNTPLVYTPSAHNYSNTPSNASPFTNNNPSPNNYPNTPSTPSHFPAYPPANTAAANAAARPRAQSYNTPLSTTPPFSIPTSVPLSASAVPTLARSNSLSSKSPPFRLSISPFKEPPFGGTPATTTPESQPSKPKPNVRMSGILGSSMPFETGESLLNKDKVTLVSSNSNASSFVPQDEPAFATVGSVSADSEIGEFIKMCQAAPPLKLFSMLDSRSTVSRLLSENYNYADLSKFDGLDLNAS